MLTQVSTLLCDETAIFADASITELRSLTVGTLSPFSFLYEQMAHKPYLNSSSFKNHIRGTFLAVHDSG